MNRYGYTAKHVRCDCCQRDYLPQHIHRLCRWWWVCDNCTFHSYVRRLYVIPEGLPIEPEPRRRHHHDRLVAA